MRERERQRDNERERESEWARKKKKERQSQRKKERVRASSREKATGLTRWKLIWQIVQAATKWKKKNRIPYPWQSRIVLRSCLCLFSLNVISISNFFCNSILLFSHNANCSNKDFFSFRCILSLSVANIRFFCAVSCLCAPSVNSVDKIVFSFFKFEICYFVRGYKKIILIT